jgi:HPt (histidine-containing phosphotransfer) domain-containing protein
MTQTKPSEPIRSKYHENPIYEPLIAEFLEDLPDLQETIQREVNSGDPKRGRQACHQLKGSAATYGFSALADVMEQLETHMSQKADGPVNTTDDSYTQDLISRFNLIVQAMLMP